MLKKLLSRINPVEVIKVLKGSDDRAMSKGMFKMGASGLLIPSGITLITDGAANENWYEIVSGGIMLLVGAVLAVMLSNTVEDLKNGK
jgi:hypothetical protein